MGVPWRDKDVNFVDGIVEGLPSLLHRAFMWFEEEALKLFDGKPLENPTQWSAKVDDAFLTLYKQYVLRVLVIHQTAILQLLDKSCYTVTGGTHASRKGINYNSLANRLSCAHVDLDTPEKIKEFGANANEFVMMKINEERQMYTVVRNMVLFPSEQFTNGKEHEPTVYGHSDDRYWLARYVTLKDFDEELAYTQLYEKFGHVYKKRADLYQKEKEENQERQELPKLNIKVSDEKQKQLSSSSPPNTKSKKEKKPKQKGKPSKK